MTTLTILIPDQPPQQVELTKNSYTIGRSSDNDISIRSPVVSRQHGLLERRGAEWVYTDLNSRNGSFVEGRRIQQVPMREDTRLQLGKEAGRAVLITLQPTGPAQHTETRHAAEGMDARRNVASQPAPQTETVNVSVPASTPVAPEFIVREMGGSIQKYPLAKPVMRLGRASDNDIVISSKLVSKYHLRVESQAGQVTITDLNSTNGTQVNGSRILPNQSVPLHPGDVLRVGDLTGNSISITFGRTTGGVRAQSVGKLDLGKLATQPSITIGRASTCDLVMAHPSVSKQHAMILRQDGAILLRDSASTNGTFVNGVRVNQVVLRDGDEIQIGPFRWVYNVQQQQLAGSRRLGHRLDAIRLVRQVKGGYTILNDVSVSIQSSEFVALVGGSGAGKSTLLKALNGYEPATKGRLLIDGQDLYNRLDMYRTEMGYVPQDDIIHRELPVRLALWYAAKLRLPDANAHEIKKSIDDALAAVEMTEHQKKRVRDLSGGQRKRVSIASELLAQPTLFFLDEPTSGLDPGLEKKMMYDLKRLADQGRTIVLVTHATSNIDQCDYVAFMARGQLAYYGPPVEAPGFFDANDFADIYQKLSYDIDPAGGVQPQLEIQQEYQDYLSAKGAASKSGKVSAAVLWAERFRKSEIYQKYVAMKQASLRDSRQPNLAGGVRRVRMPAPFTFVRQLYYLARRQFDLIRHDFRTLLILLVMLPLIGLLFGVSSKSWWLTGKGWENSSKKVITAKFEDEMKADLTGKAKDTSNTYTPYQDASILVAMIALALTQGGTFAASYEIVKERPIFNRERAVNLSVWAYVLAKVVVLSLFAVIQVTGMLLLLGMFVDFNVPGVIFTDFSILEIFITLYLGVLASIGLGLFISAMVPSADVVLYVILAQLFLQIVLTGTLFPLPANPASYAVPGYWATDALSSIVDLPRLDKEGKSCVVVEVPEVNTTTGETTTKLEVHCEKAASNAESLKNYKHEAGHLIQAWFAMGAQLMLFTLLTIIVQARKKPGKD